MEWLGKNKYFKYVVSNKTFIGVIFIGVVFRLFAIFSIQVWKDEVFFLRIAVESSFKDLILLRHWLIDHPQLYPVFLKLFSYITTNHFFIRLSNIIFYLLSVMYVVRISKIINEGKWLLIPAIIYSIHPYFVGIGWQISPYNILILFFLVSMNELLKIIVFNDRKTYLWVYLTLMWLSSYQGIFFLVSIYILSILFFLFRVESARLIIKNAFLGSVLLILQFMVLFGRLHEFPSLATHFVASSNILNWFFYVLLGSDSLFMYILTTIFMILIFYFIYKNIRSDVDNSLNFSVIILFILSIVIIEVVHLTWYPIVNSKMFFYPVLLFLFALQILGNERNYFRLIFCLVLLLILKSSSSRDWLMGRYLYDPIKYDARLLREDLIRYYQSNNAHDTKIITNWNMRVGEWWNADPFVWYYARCMDEFGECNFESSWLYEGDWVTRSNEKYLILDFTKNTLDYYAGDVCGKDQCTYYYQVSRQ